MILAYRGRWVDEAEVAVACGTLPLRGTQPDNAVAGIQRLGYHALWFENASLSRLQDLIEHDWPVIVFLRARDLPSDGRGLHGVVVIGMGDEGAIILDPQSKSRYTVARKSFLSAWQALDAQGMVIWPLMSTSIAC